MPLKPIRHRLLAALLPVLLLATAPTLMAADAPATGKLVGWGLQSNGALANGVNGGTTTTPVNATASAFNGASVTRVADGYGGGGCAIAGGKLYCWGAQSSGRLGNGQSSLTVNTPVAVCTTADTGSPCNGFSQMPSSATVTDVSLGDSHACAVADGKAYCWGALSDGRVGTGTTSTGITLYPAAVNTGASSALNNKTVTRISAGGSHTCALTSDGTAACWGAGINGATGVGNYVSSLIPKLIQRGAIPANALITDISAGNNHTCAVADGRAYCWGQQNNVDGRLGNNSSSNSATPVAVFTSASSTPSALPDDVPVTQISAGGVHTCAVAGGKAYCWGNGATGMLGNDSTNTSTIPVAVTDNGVLAGVSLREVRTGISSTLVGGSCALSTQGLAYCWGDERGVGDGRATANNAAVTTPVAVTTASPSALNGFRLRRLSFRATNVAVQGVTAAAAAAPTALMATSGDGQVSVAFTAPADDGGFAITNFRYSTDNGSTYSDFSPAVTSSPVNITGLSNGTAYAIKLRAVTLLGDGLESVAVSATPVSASAPGACGTASGTPSSTAPETHLCATGTATEVSGSSSAWTWGCKGSGGGQDTAPNACSANYPKPKLTLSANAGSINVGASTSVSAQSDNGLAPTLSTSTSVLCTLGTPSGSSAVTASVTGAAAGTCTVAANQPAVTTGTSRYLAADEKTVSITVTKQTQTIGTPSLSASSILVGATSTVSATASSELPVSYSASPSDVCSNNGGTVTGVGAGNCTVIVSQAGNAMYEPALAQFVYITVNAAPVNGACGSAKTSQPTAPMPSSNLCTAGVASPVTGANGRWAWSCNGTHGGDSDNSCSAPYGNQALSLSATPSAIQVGQTSTVLASSSAALPVTLVASGNACSLSGTTATGVSAGQCTLTASQPGTGDNGNSRYLAASDASTVLTVSAASRSACEVYLNRPNVNVVDLSNSPGGQTVRGNASKFNVIFGSAFVDTITGGNVGNCIDGGAGNDRLTAGSGENYLYGGDGNDTLTPGTGSTAMDGGDGTDKCAKASSRATASYANCESN